MLPDYATLLLSQIPLLPHCFGIWFEPILTLAWPQRSLHMAQPSVAEVVSVLYPIPICMHMWLPRGSHSHQPMPADLWGRVLSGCCCGLGLWTWKARIAWVFKSPGGWGQSPGSITEMWRYTTEQKLLSMKRPDIATLLSLITLWSRLPTTLPDETL